MCACGKATCLGCRRPAVDELTVQDLGMLRLASQWGWLTPQGGMAYLLCGSFSLATVDLARLLTYAGALPMVPRDVHKPLLAGDTIAVMGRGVPVWQYEAVLELRLKRIDEAELVQRLVADLLQ